jgi:hypothetical protein
MYDSAVDRRVREFLGWYEKSDIVAADLHLNNVVFDDTLDSMVLIDGIGDKTLLPIRAWFPAINQFYNRKRARQIRTEIAYRFMATALRKDVVLVLIWISGVSLGIDMMDGELIDG